MSFFLPDQTVRGAQSYEEACRRHAWKILPRYNVAVDLCDRRAEQEGRALVWNDDEGRSRIRAVQEAAVASGWPGPIPVRTLCPSWKSADR